MNQFRSLALSFGPIVRALTRSRAGAVLIALQCAITLAILTNAIFIIQDRLQKMARPSGVDVEHLFSVLNVPFAPDYDARTAIETDISMLRAQPGVIDAAVINMLPLSSSGSSSAFAGKADAKPDEYSGAARYETDAHGLNTLGLKLVAGRNFLEEEVIPHAPISEWGKVSVILTQAYAKKLFPPDGDAVGKLLYDGGHRGMPIVGIVERLQMPWLTFGELEHSVIMSTYTLGATRYVIRTAPAERQALMPRIEELLGKSSNERLVLQLRTQNEVEARTYSEYRAMAAILSAVIVLIVMITGLGIVGLASFNVSARKKQIGTRRALGAQKGDIIRYFLVESWIITSLGALIGAALSFVLSYWMANTFDLPPLDWRYVPVGVLFLWVLGLLAVWVPARRAAQLPPALATRSV